MASQKVWCKTYNIQWTTCIIHLKKVIWALTFVEALLTVHDGNLVSSKTRGPVELTVVLVQLPIWTAHRFIVWFTVIQALTLPLVGLMVDHTVTPQAAVLVFAWTWIASVPHKTWVNTQKKKRQVTFFFFLSDHNIRLYACLSQHMVSLSLCSS